eukprot:1515902-Pyramimonas_sp.AAC.1
MVDVTQARVLPKWTLDAAAPLTADEPPPSPYDCTSDACGVPRAVELVPYGATNLRMGALPWILAPQ